MPIVMKDTRTQSKIEVLVLLINTISAYLQSLIFMMRSLPIIYKVVECLVNSYIVIGDFNTFRLLDTLYGESGEYLL